MLLDLLKRDLRLHWDVMTLPYLVLALLMGAIGIANESAAMVGMVFIGSLFVPFLPMAIHLRETSQGTMGDLVSLPVSRTALVGLRYVEVLLFTVAMIALVYLGSSLVLSVAAHKFVTLQSMGREGAFPIAMLVILCFAYPMPFTFRWDGKGLVAAIVLLSTVPVAIGLLVPQKVLEPLSQATFKVFLRLLAHPGEMLLVFLGLMLVSYLISLKAFLGRDF
jgi:ABC-type transport system involved in multi-copper enzyme maturation permease subunit